MTECRDELHVQVSLERMINMVIDKPCVYVGMMMRVSYLSTNKENYRSMLG